MKNILIAPAHYRVYRSASRRLIRRMGANAPTAEKLIQHELSQRTSRLIADEYLDSIGWRRRRRLQPRVVQSRAASLVERCLGRSGSLAPEPGRN